MLAPAHAGCACRLYPGASLTQCAPRLGPPEGNEDEQARAAPRLTGTNISDGQSLRS
jgi:hypothetical protein